MCAGRPRLQREAEAEAEAAYEAESPPLTEMQRDPLPTPISARRLLRALSTLLILAGVAVLAWTVVVWQWQDPFTYLLMQREQRALAKRYDDRATRYRPPRSPTASRVPLAVEAQRYRRVSEPGGPIGRLRIPKLDIDLVVLNGTDSDTLKKGPGRHLSSFMPGEGELTYVAGHRTTYGAPFADIDRLKRGDRVRFELPYGTFEYAVTGRRIVPATYLRALESREREELALQACWPRFFASQRIIVYARPMRIFRRTAEQGRS